MPSTDPNTRPFNLDPKSLRTLMRETSFTTPEAMKILGLQEPRATETLVEMARSGWIEYQGFSPYHDMSIDSWSPARLGINFALKKLMKRTSVAEGEKLLAKAIEAARQFNEEERAYVITKMTLFGSLVRGGDENGTIGDVDLQVETETRKYLPEEELERRKAADREGTPNNWYAVYDKDWWAKRRPIRAIRAVSKRLSASEHRNIEDMGCEHRVVYAYDPATDSEIQFNPDLVPADPERQKEFNKLPENKELPEIPTNRALPSFPSRRPEYNQACPQTALYGWVRGRSLEELAKRMGTSKEDVQTALAAQGCQLPDPSEAEIYPSILETLDRYLKKYRNHRFEISISPDGNQSTIIVRTFLGKKEGTITSGKNGYADGERELIMIGQKIIPVVQRWHGSIRRLIDPLRISLNFVLTPGTLSYNIIKEKTQDVREIKTTTMTLFEHLWEAAPAKEMHGGYRKRCSLRITSKPKFAIEERDPQNWSERISHENKEIEQSMNCFLRHITGGNAGQFSQIDLQVSRSERTRDRHLSF